MILISNPWVFVFKCVARSAECTDEHPKYAAKLGPMFEMLDVNSDGNVSWDELKQHGLVLERFDGDTGVLLGDGGKFGEGTVMSPDDFEKFVVSSLELVFRCLDKDGSQQLEAGEQEVVWQLFGVYDSFEARPAMGCVEFVDWIIDTGMDLGWAGFQAGFLKMLEQAYYAVAFINDRATDSVKLVRQASI